MTHVILMFVSLQVTLVRLRVKFANRSTPKLPNGERREKLRLFLV